MGCLFMQQQIDNLRAELEKLQEEVSNLKINYKDLSDKFDIHMKTSRDNQKTMLVVNQAQTDELTKISERYQMQVEHSQKNEERTIQMNRWLLGILWTLLSVVLVVVITTAVTTIVGR